MALIFHGQDVEPSNKIIDVPQAEGVIFFLIADQRDIVGKARRTGRHVVLVPSFMHVTPPCLFKIMPESDSVCLLL